ncbi:hypothetical protein SteCoe_32914 [Stentor coeruleus]|uniref:Polyadenylate-binding protein n=1 Tax=Stentor coeruleus TaxID=5963 RepID=A0A1R2AY07_9CILI|nr:hypothetical protein SteCoe_32914 [Stentor coeruleus]
MQNKPVAKIPAQLYMGGLDLRVKEADLYNLLKRFGDISNIRLCRDNTSSYAFIAFKDPEVSTQVQRELNGFEFRNKHIHVSKAIQQQWETVANIFVKNIPDSVTPKEFGELFSKFGSIISCKLCHDTEGKSLSYGFVQYESSEYAETAIKNMNGKYWKGNELIVQIFVPLGLRINATANSNLYVRGFPSHYIEDDLRNAFAPYGKVLSVAIMLDNGRAYGFVCFSTAEEARAACEGKNNTQDHDFVWYVMPHMSKIHRKKVLREQYLMQVDEWKKKNLYIKNLDKSIDENRLYDICKEYGPIKSLKICKMENIKYDSDGNCKKEAVSKEIAYVHFENEHHASIAMNELQKKLIEGKKLYVAKWKPRDAMKKIIGQFKTQKNMKFPIMPNRGFMPTRAVPIFPIMGKSNIMPYQQHMPRARVPRTINPPIPPPPPMHIPIVNEQKKPLVFRVDNIDQYSIRDLGENLYPIVLKLTNPQVVGKITGMLLEMDKIEVINLINDESILRARVGEAVEVLKKAWAQNKDALAVLSSLG